MCVFLYSYYRSLISRFGIRAKTEIMGDIVEATGKVKEGGGSSSIKCPMLNQTNYTVWVMRMRITLKVHEVWKAIEIETASVIPLKLP